MDFPIIFAIGWAVFLGLGGGLLTTIGSWYRALKKPSWQPPDWLLGPAWTIILGLAGWAFVLAWRGTGSEAERTLLIPPYLVWVSFAAFLDWTIVRLNRPFGGSA